jgi:tetratricopeptide (TPR) repeat protein
VPAAASLEAATPERARGLLSELTGAHLLTEHAPGRYTLHDLLRAYAAEQALVHDSQAARDAALRRAFDHYLHTANHAAVQLEQYLAPLPLAAPEPSVTLAPHGSAEDLLSWFTAEHATLLAVVQAAADAGMAAHTWQLGWTLTSFLLRRGLWDEQLRVCQLGLAAAREAGDAAGRAYATCGLALGYARSGRMEEAVPLFEDALGQFGELGDRVTQAVIHSSLSWLSERRQRPADMLSHARKAFELYATAGHRLGQVIILNDIGYSYAMLGDYHRALLYCERALAGVQELGEPGSEEPIWDSLGYIHHQLGHHDHAITCYERSIGLCRERADRYNEAITLDHLGDVHRSAGNVGAARRTWALALRILEEMDHPDGDQVRAKLFPGGARLHAVPALPAQAAEPEWPLVAEPAASMRM